MIRILTTYYNSPKYVFKCIESLKMQSFKKWKCYITNDCSTDGSEKYIEYLIKDDKRFVLINNKTKQWQTGNYYQIVHRPEIKKEDICITVDGDDWLPDGNVFDRVLSYYDDGKTWMTFGQFLFYQGNGLQMKPGFSYKPNPFSSARTAAWTSTHLRTFKAGLFRKIKKEDLLHPNGGFIDMAGDVACFSPCLEMSGEDRVKYVNDINYIYNTETTLNEFKTDLNNSMVCSRIVASRPRYKRIESYD